MPARNSVKTLIVLGPGGHSTEMFHLLASLPPSKFSPRLYAYPDSDWISDCKARAYESAREDGSWEHVPAGRGRGVGETVWTAWWAVLVGVWVAWGVLRKERPQLILCNGPGICIPFILVASLLRLCFTAHSHTKIVFVESFARVENLSLSGRIAYRFADSFYVQWPGLKLEHPKAKYHGMLV